MTAMHTTTGVILAAGAGLRLRDLTATRPKCLLEVGGRSILDRALDALAGAEVSRVVVVAGYRGELVREAVRRRRTPGTLVVHNDHWGATGTGASLATGLSAVPESDRVIIVEGDVLFEPHLLSLLPQGRQVTLGSPWSPTLMGSMLVVDDDGRVVDWLHVDDGSRLPRNANGCFKSVNITALTCQFALHELLPVLRSCVAERPDASLEWSLSSALHASRRSLALCSVPADSWCEVDDASDLAVARDRFRRDA